MSLLVVDQWGKFRSVIHFEYNGEKTDYYILSNQEVVNLEDQIKATN